jgi:hypothetical protein
MEMHAFIRSASAYQQFYMWRSVSKQIMRFHIKAMALFVN